MSAQSGTIAPRRTVELPLWVAGAVALIVLGLVAALTIAQVPDERTASVSGSIVQRTYPGRTVVSTGHTAHVFPGALETSGIGVRVGFAPVTDTMANIREGGAVFPAGMALDVRPGGPLGNDAWTGSGEVTGGGPQAIMIGDYACHQCG